MCEQASRHAAVSKDIPDVLKFYLGVNVDRLRGEYNMPRYSGDDFLPHLAPFLLA